MKVSNFFPLEYLHKYSRVIFILSMYVKKYMLVAVLIGRQVPTATKFSIGSFFILWHVL